MMVPHGLRRLQPGALRALPLADIMLVLVVATALALPALLWTLQDTLGSAMAQRSGGAAVLFLRDDQPDTQREVDAVLRDSAGVQGWDHLSANAARTAFADYLGLSAQDALRDTLDVPATTTVRLDTALAAAAAADMTARWREHSRIDDVWWDRDERDRNLALYALVRNSGYVLTLILLGAGMAIIAGSVGGRLAREQPAIAVMTLLGATDRFIMRPHVLHALLLGGAAAVVAHLLLLLGNTALRAGLAPLEALLALPLTVHAPSGALLLWLYLGAPLLAATTTILVVRWQLQRMRTRSE